ncbi:hypothetical protein HPB52_017895 [Rhipicephalus sanguineus]|uniref:Uncharacterized protein n=1 Tax=Rhipicephalus sanguineus TaxID=34632 RepID=A0A9D4PDC0_RHISA|nr:hypothetical protein HPB52_017895 [Rhipicephalus sanguineus]
MVIGIPNVGKSLINALRKMHLGKKGMEFQVKPWQYSSTKERCAPSGTTFRPFTAALSWTQDVRGLVPLLIVCYVDYLGLDEPCEDIRLVLYKTALNMRAVNKVRTYEGWSLRPNQEAAAVNLIQGFRRGLLGRITFLPDSGNSMLDAARQPSAA